MKKIDRRIVIIASLIFIVGMAFGLMKYLISLKEAPPMKMPKESKRLVKAEPVKYHSIVSPVFAPGRVSSLREVDIIAEAAGKIQQGRVALKKAAEFRKGQVLFTIYPDEAALALKSRKSKFLTSLANLLPDIGLDYPEHEKEYRTFFESIDIDRPLPPLPDIKDEKLKIFLAGKNIISDYYSIKKDELQLSRHTVRAPFNGTYSVVNMEAGSYANPGTKVAHAIATDELEIEVPLERFNSGWVKIGDKVKLSSPLRDRKWTGKVIRKGSFVDPATQSQLVFVKVDKHKGEDRMLPGEYIRADFPGQEIKDAMEIPRNAVFNTNEVFIVMDGRLQKRHIEIIKKNENSLIFKGLEVGNMIVIQPLINVTEGTMVETGKAQGRKKDKEQKKKPGTEITEAKGTKTKQ